MTPNGRQALVVRAAERVCALPLAHSVETMRPLRSDPISGMPPFVRGVSIIRGEPVPVLDLATLLSGKPGREVSRFVLLQVEKKRFALAVEAVVGIRSLSLPTKTERAELIEVMGALDRELLVSVDVTQLASDKFLQSFKAFEPKT